MNWGNIATTVLTGALALFIPWISQRLLPAQRWASQIQRDLALLKEMDSKQPATVVFAENVNAQVRRLTDYRSYDVGVNFWVRRVGVVVGFLWFAVSIGVVAWAAIVSKSVLLAVQSVPWWLWACAILDLVFLLWLCSGGSKAKLSPVPLTVVKPKRFPW